MAGLGGYYLNPHVSQFDGSKYADENCTPTSGANGSNAATGGHIHMNGAQFRGLVPRSAETQPANPGWSLEDLDHACAKAGVGFVVDSGQGWAALIAALNGGHYVALQGDSDQFSNNTCSGAFNGDHCVGIHPATRVVGGLRQHWIDDPICKTGRWEYDYILHRYAAKLNSNIRFGVFTHSVPKIYSPAPPPTVVLRYGGVALRPPQVKTIAVPKGQRANVRVNPNRGTPPTATLPNGATFTAYQRTNKGEDLAGSTVWYGNRLGTGWLHVTAF